MAYTSMPYLTIQELDSSGNPYASAKMFFYAAGTTTKQDTYSTANGTPNANPVILDSAGRATVFFAPMTYDVVLAPSTDSDPPVSPIWTRSGILPVPTSSSDLDVTGTAGEALAAGKVVYVSDGSGGLTAGRWYLADADNAYSSTTAPAIGMTPSAISNGESGSIRVLGRETGLSGLVAGTLYYVSATAGSLTSSAPANAKLVGVADSTTTLLLTQTIPYASATVPGIVSTGTQTFGGVKTLTSPVLTTPAITTPTITSGGSWAGSPTLTTPAITTPTITSGGSWAGSPTLTTPTITTPALTTGGTWTGAPTITTPALITGGTWTGAPTITTPALITGGTWTGAPTITTPALITGGSWTGSPTITSPIWAAAPTGINSFVWSYASANFTKNASTVFGDVTGLSFAVSANQSYVFQIYVFAVSTTVADIKFTLTGPAAPTAIRYAAQNQADSASVAAFGSTLSITMSGNDASVLLFGQLRNGANAGTVQLQAAQDTSEATNTVIYAESYLQAFRVV